MAQPNRHVLLGRAPVALMVVLMLLLAACGGGDETEDPEPGSAATDGTGGEDEPTDAAEEPAAEATFVYAAAGVPETLDAWTAYQGDPTRTQMYEWGSTLVEYAPDALDDACATLATTENVRPGLAESWDVADDGTITFNLRQGVMSAAGNELTAEDVVWSLDRARELSPVVQFLMANVSHFPEEGAFEAVDDATVQVNVDKATALDISLFTYPLLMIHDSKQIADEAGGDDADAVAEWMTTHTANYGPWVLESFEPGTEASYSANPNFWDTERRGNITELIIRNVGESSTRAQLIQTGEADYAERLSFQEYADLDEGGAVNIVNCISPNRDTLMMNTKFEPFADPEVRKAISMAINRDALVEGVYLGFAEASTTGMSRIYLDDTEGLQTFTYDPEAAKSVLEGMDLSFAIMASPTRPGAHAESLAVQIQAMLSDVGVDASVDVVPGSTEFSDAFFAGEYEAVIYLEPPALGDPYYSANLYNTTVSFQNTFKYDNQEYDDLAVQIEETEPGPERQAAIREISDLIIEDVPQAYLVERTYNHAFAPGVDGYLNTPHGSLLTYQMTKS